MFSSLLTVVALVVPLATSGAGTKGTGMKSAVNLPRDPAASAVVDLEDPPLFPLKDVKAGMKGRSWTVFSSSKGPEELQFEVLGVMRGYLGPGEDLIIARLSGPLIERTGVIAGMSGSPAYIDGKLVGAIGYRFGQFTKDPIAGITPIERMLTGAVEPTSTSGNGRVLAGPGSSGGLPLTPWGQAEAIATPILTSGLSPRVQEAFAPELQKRGYGTMIAAGSSTTNKDGVGNKPVRFYPSGPIAGLLVDGDLSMSGVGTVTWVKGDRFLAFGHPFLGIGRSEMPVSNAEIVVTVASEAGSWKMGQATAAVGRLTDDRLHAIAGTMGDLPRTVPVVLTFDLPSPRKAVDAQTTDRFTVLRHPTDTPLFTAIAVANALQNRVAVDAGGTYDVVVDTVLSTGDRLVLPTRVADKNADPSLPAAFAVLGALSALTDSDFRDVQIESVAVTVKGRADVEVARVVSAAVVSGGEAGKPALLSVRLQAFQGPAREQRVPFVVPRGLAPGSYAVVAAGAAAAARIEREGGLVLIPTSFSDELEQVKSQPPPGSLSVYLVRDEASPRLEGRALPGLPDSLAEITSGAGGVLGGGSFDARATRLARTSATGVINGEASARITVPAPSAD